MQQRSHPEGNDKRELAIRGITLKRTSLKDKTRRKIKGCLMTPKNIIPF
jgi:hypothetical protein